MGFKLSCWYWASGYEISSRPSLRSMKLSTMPDCSGPGRNKATNAIISSKQSGFNRRTRSFMPRDSSWNTAVVSARSNSSILFLSSSGMVFISTGALPSRFMRSLVISTAHCKMVNVRKPKKSNLTRPAVSTSFLSNCVTGNLPSSSQ